MRTFGIEEEFQFLDRVTLQPADVGAEVYAALMASPQWADVTHKEFLASQVEHASAVFSSIDDARAALLGFRRFLADRADELGVVAASIGTDSAGTAASAAAINTLPNMESSPAFPHPDDA